MLSVFAVSLSVCVSYILFSSTSNVAQTGYELLDPTQQKCNRNRHVCRPFAALRLSDS